MNVVIPNRTGVYAIRRLYDRESGNFKAVGWTLEITTYSVDRGYNTIYLGILDNQIPNVEQMSL